MLVGFAANDDLSRIDAVVIVLAILILAIYHIVYGYCHFGKIARGRLEISARLPGQRLIADTTRIGIVNIRSLQHLLSTTKRHGSAHNGVGTSSRFAMIAKVYIERHFGRFQQHVRTARALKAETSTHITYKVIRALEIRAVWVGIITAHDFCAKILWQFHHNLPVICLTVRFIVGTCQVLHRIADGLAHPTLLDVIVCTKVGIVICIVVQSLVAPLKFLHVQFHCSERVAIIAVYVQAQVTRVCLYRRQCELALSRQLEVGWQIELCQKTRSGFDVHVGVDNTAQVASACIGQHRIYLNGARTDCKHRVDGRNLIFFGYHVVPHHCSIIITRNQSESAQQH